MVKQPLVSIIIPTFNRAHLIGETLDSVLNQTYENWECIVVDDGSTDYTIELLDWYAAKSPKIKYYNRPNNFIKGANSCRNYGLKKSSGIYCIFLDSDDLLTRVCLVNRLTLVASERDFYFYVFPLYVSSDRIKPHNLPKKEKCLDNFLKNKFTWQTTCVLWNKKFLKNLNGFNDHLPRLNDPELHIRAILKANDNYKVVHKYTPDSIYRIGFNNRGHNAILKDYYKSICIFIPLIFKELGLTGLSDKKRYLRSYFLDFIRLSSFALKKRHFYGLILCCHKNKILNFKEIIFLLNYGSLFFLSPFKKVNFLNKIKNVLKL